MKSLGDYLITHRSLINCDLCMTDERLEAFSPGLAPIPLRQLLFARTRGTPWRSLPNRSRLYVALQVIPTPSLRRLLISLADDILTRRGSRLPPAFLVAAKGLLSFAKNSPPGGQHYPEDLLRVVSLSAPGRNPDARRALRCFDGMEGPGTLHSPFKAEPALTQYFNRLTARFHLQHILEKEPHP